MLQMDDCVDKKDEQDVDARHRINLHAATQKIAAQAIAQAHNDGERINENHLLHRMHAPHCQRRQHFRRVVNLVELPQQRMRVRSPVEKPIGELISKKAGEGDDGHSQHWVNACRACLTK